jgi:hypothetical protein
MRHAICLFFVAFGAAAAAQQLGPSQDSFCQRYAIALFGNANATTEQNLITAVVTRAVSGNTAVSPSVTGIVNVPSQVKYFNGTGGGSGTNYYTNSAAFNSLAGKLVNFFATAMGCREMSLSSVANMKSVHGPMNIPANVWNDFINQLVYTLQSFGITATGQTGDLTYAAALLQQFGLNGPQQICAQSGCPQWTDFAEFNSGTDGSGNPKWYTGALATSVTIQAGGNVHWNIAANQGIQQTQSDFATNVTSGVIPTTSGATSRTLTVAFPNAGTYYFVGQGHAGTQQGTIVVTAGSSTAGSTGSSAGSSSTGSNGFKVSASMTVVVAAIAITLAAKAVQ